MNNFAKIKIVCGTLLIMILLSLHVLAQKQDYDPRIHSKVPGVKEAFYAEQFDDMVNNSEYVFEGIFQKIEYYAREDKNGRKFCAVSRIVKITKVFRGKLKLGTIELVLEAPQYGAYNHHIPDKRETFEFKHFDDSVYIFFCNKTKEFPYDKRYNIYKVDNNVFLAKANKYLDCQFSVGFVNGYFGMKTYRPEINSKIDLYKEMLKMPNINRAAIREQDTVPEPSRSSPGAYRRVFNQAEIDSLRKIRLDKKREQKKNQPSGRVKLKSETIDSTFINSYNYARKITRAMAANSSKMRSTNYTFAASVVNQTSTIDADGNVYYEFDVQANVNNTDLYYAYSSIDLHLPSQVFTLRQHNEDDALKINLTSYNSNYKISVDKYSIVNDNEITLFQSEIYYCSTYNVTTKTCNGTAVNPNRHKINGSELLYHVKILANQCGSSSQISFVQPGYNYAGFSLSQSTIMDWTQYDTFTTNTPPACSLSCPSVTGISIEESSIGGTSTAKTLYIDAGTSLSDFSISLLPFGFATYTSVVWSSNNANISISQNGDLLATVTAKTAGTSKLTVTLVSTNGRTYKDNVDITIRPVISNITSNRSPIAAGDGQIITITGYGFGDSRGSNSVQFSSADAESKYIPDNDNFDYISTGSSYWSNTRINMYLPGQVMNAGNVYECIGDGKINVNISDIQSNDYTNFHIYHDYLQVVDGDNNKYRLLPANSNMSFSLSSTIKSNSTAVRAIKLAMAYWSCKLNVNISVDESSTSPNLITSANNPAASWAMLTERDGILTTAGRDGYQPNITITINSSIGWNYDLPIDGVTISSAVENFYYDFLHELGHVFCLGHIKIANELMYYVNSNLIDLNNTSYAVSDAQTRVSASSANLWLSTISSSTCPLSPTITALVSNFQTPNSVNLTWNEADPGAAITIIRSDGVNTVTVTNTTGSATSFTDNTVSANKNYTYTVTSQNTWAQSSATTSVYTTPPAASPSGSIELISWPPVPGASGYKVQRSSSSTGTFVVIGTVSSSATSFSDATITTGETYYYQVITTFASGSSSVSPVIMVTACLSSTGLASTASITGTLASGSTTTKQAQAITTSGSAVVSSGATLKAEATQTIGFRAGFSAKTGSTMTAHIVPVCGASKSAELVDSTAQEEGKEIQPRRGISIFPNPTGGMVTVKSTDESFKFELYNSAGILVKKGESGGNVSQIDMSTFATGIYYLNVVIHDNEQQTCTLVKK